MNYSDFITLTFVLTPTPPLTMYKIQDLYFNSINVDSYKGINSMNFEGNLKQNG